MSVNFGEFMGETFQNFSTGYPDYLEKVNTIAAEAGTRILRHFRRKPVVITHKDDASPLTAADMESHQYVVSQLEALDPTIPIISEEAQLPDYEIRKKWMRFWLVDPLDGTKEFLKGSDEFTVNIALIENQEPILGVVYVPGKHLLYYAAKGQGSWKREGETLPTRIFSSFPNLSQGLVVVESKSHPSTELEKFLNDLPVRERINAGSSLKFCLVAEGSADIYPRMNPTMEWDVAAGDCIYRNSAPVGLRSSSLTYNKPSLKNDSFVIGFK
jgi:3'(2'), 5'-bisphosphate nucleotidase